MKVKKIEKYWTSSERKNTSFIQMLYSKKLKKCKQKYPKRQELTSIIKDKSKDTYWIQIKYRAIWWFK